MRTKSKILRQKPPADFEEVKRRFIRQNRELAKHNSNQSLRIRTLELDISRLLADNLELRNQNLRLQHELYTAQTQASAAAVRTIKDALQEKIAELNGLVDGIADVQEHERIRERKPVEGNWRERQPLSELMRDNQMPTIMEDTSYPRRTLEASEIQPMRLSDQSSNESPDLGPPPVARFDYVDPVKNDSPLVNRVSPEMPDEEELQASFLVNLETRRKKRDGQPKLEIRRHSILPPQSPGKGENEASSMLRTGAKRKLADRETEKPMKPLGGGDFTFSRKATTTEIKLPPEAAASKPSTEAPALPSPKPTRKILGEKSVNMSPRKSPAKVEKPEKERLDEVRPASGKDVASRRRRPSAIPMLAPVDGPTETVEVEPPASEAPPQTPAEPDLFSPTPSEPSTLREQGRGDTPPPGELSTLSVDGAGRPSRRARSAVNYAEPSLILKMRRPDKKMVDALTGLQDHRRAMSVSEDRKMSAQSTLIKKEPMDEDAWKVDLPSAGHAVTSSPLTQKSGGEDLPASPQMLSEKTSTSSATMSALMAASRKRRESHHGLQPLGTDMDAATKKMEELDLYEFKDSSSPQAEEGVRPKGKGHRRHSSVPKDGGAGEHLPVRASSGVGKSDRAASRRKSMML